MEQETLMKSKWEGNVSTKIEDVNADQIWPLIKDFFGIYKYFPNLQVSYGVQGNNGEVGSIRYCEQVVSPTVVHWAKEKITAVDPDQRSLTFEIIDGNSGLRSCVATVKVVDPSGEHDDQSLGCVLSWTFSFDALEGVKFEDLVKKYQMWIEICAQNMKDSLVK
uniref:OLC1v1029097C1 n=1 Tax=Oldenlandia corymbosa var. corymbosa TaxID=529605 RepID=A0AAV1CD78_OLDCO|nr:OLC1v1029097C1 [Oldenlandia corymbosa var. corymbosa]